MTRRRCSLRPEICGEDATASGSQGVAEGAAGGIGKPVGDWPSQV